MIVRCLPAAAALFFTVGCATGPRTPTPLIVSSTANEYELSGPNPAEILATNQSDRQLFVDLCPLQERLTAPGVWQPNGAFANKAPCYALFALKPGATDTIVGTFITAPGTYRVGVMYGSDSAFTGICALSIGGSPSGMAFSDGFAVVR